ncbi:MAG: hypothetical protein H7318_13855 [Oligoflexus sp.]|nr:hypothetical protein [Oligoflexus sp.]
MTKILKKSKKMKSVTIDQIEAASLRGEDTSKHFGKAKRMPPREVQKMEKPGNIVKLNVDLTEEFLRELDEVALFLNISRQAVMKTYLKDGVDRHFFAKQARRMG